MAALLDTNILLRSVQTRHPHFALVERALAVLRSRKEALYVTNQHLIEFWAVATRPEGSENGLGLTTENAVKELAVLKELFTVLPEPNGLFEEWERLVSAYRVSGKNTHDAKLVASMRLQGINRILTFNVPDFARYPGIEILHPKAI